MHLHNSVPVVILHLSFN